MAGPVRTPAAQTLLPGLLVTLASTGVQAFVPTPEDECRMRNEAICELDGIRFQQPAACPPTAKTLRPLGREDCRRAGGSVQASGPATTPPLLGDRRVSPADQGSGHVVERSGVRTVVVFVLAGLLILGASVFALRRAAKDPRGALRRVIVGLCAAALGALAAQAVFHRVFDHPSHDTAAPWLLAVAAAALVFTLVFRVATVVLRRVTRSAG